MRFINPNTVVAQVGLKPGQTVADLGCGSGYYSLAAAKIVGNTGMVYAVDVQEAKLTATHSAGQQNGLKNINVVKADLDKPLLDIEEGSCDVVIVASILHEIGSRDMLLKNTYRILKTGGLLLAVEWKKEMTPIGPPVDVRLAPQDLENELGRLGLRKTKDIAADAYHYAIVFTK
jgi:ubiquinone/menaquinone biosynthesis C-methylase UbiE